MTIQIGEKIPSSHFTQMTADGIKKISTDDFFKGKKVIVFAVPGAFTPTCSNQHLPGFVAHAAALKAKGVDVIACISINDIFVMQAWGESANAKGAVEMLADGNGEFAKALGVDFDASQMGMGTRSWRFSMLVEDGVVKEFNREQNPGKAEVSGAETILAQI